MQTTKLLTIRLDRDLGKQVKARLGADGRTLSDVIVQGLQQYVETEPGTAEPSPETLALPGQVAVHLQDLRESGESELLSATLGALHEAGWPLRPLAEALGISKQAVQARIRRPVPERIQANVAPCAPPPPFPRKRQGSPGAPRRPFTVKVDQALRSAAHKKAGREGTSLTQIVHRILDRYLRLGPVPETREVLLGDTTPTRPVR